MANDKILLNVVKGEEAHSTLTSLQNEMVDLVGKATKLTGELSGGWIRHSQSAFESTSEALTRRMVSLSMEFNGLADKLANAIQIMRSADKASEE